MWKSAKVRILPFRAHQVFEYTHKKVYQSKSLTLSLPIEVANRLLVEESAVKVFRNYRGLTQKQLAQKVGIHPVYVSQFETGKHTGSSKTLARIAEVLNIDIGELI